VANNPAGEVRCAWHHGRPTASARLRGGQPGLIHGAQMLQLGEVDLALGGGVSESIHTFGIFASFKRRARSRARRPAQASRPFDRDATASSSRRAAACTRWNASRTRARAARASSPRSSGWSSTPTPRLRAAARRAPERVHPRRAGARAARPDEIDIVSSHATATPQGDQQECEALRAVFGDCESVFVNNTKSFIGHTMGAAGALELAGNLPSFDDGFVHPTINVEHLDPACEVRNLVLGEPHRPRRIDHILNLSFGMLGINSAVIVRRAPSAA
jgi:3-oxoacyl-[acyl-carrier-protein] synthase II